MYDRHARLFCGWWLKSQQGGGGKENVNDLGNLKGKGLGVRLEGPPKPVCLDPEKVDLKAIFPSKEKEGVQAVFAFVMWLRSERGSSVSYEASMLRGITKLVKFRFSAESSSDPSYGAKSFEDVPAGKSQSKSKI